MTKFLLGTTMFAGLMIAGAAQAADMPLKAAPRAPIPFSWSGCYIGGHIGGLWGDTKWDNPDGNNLPRFVRVQNDDFSSFTGGGQVGCNLQFSPQWVLGIEADISAADVNTFVFDDVIDRDEIFRTKFDWYGSVRGRLGFTFGPGSTTLLYGTGGVAFTRITSGYENYTDSTLSVFESKDQRNIKSGWVAGGGIEHALTPAGICGGCWWVVRAEALYYDFGRKVVSPTIGLGETAKTTFTVGRVGLSLKF